MACIFIKSIILLGDLLIKKPFLISPKESQYQQRNNDKEGKSDWSKCTICNLHPSVKPQEFIYNDHREYCKEEVVLYNKSEVHTVK